MISRLMSGLLIVMALWSAPLFGQDKADYQTELEELNQLLEEYPALIPNELSSVKEFFRQRNEHLALMQKAECWQFINDRTHTWYGAANGSLPVVVITDYDCPYCKRLEPHLQRLSAQFPHVKVIHVMVPSRQQNVQGGRL